MRSYDICALGELLIDFTQAGNSSKGNPLMEANPGGAPCNVLALLTKLGHSAVFIGKVGQDGFGDQLENALVECGISTDGLLRDQEVHTTLAIVHTMPDGDRDFSFYRNPGADLMLNENEINEEMIRNSRIFHFDIMQLCSGNGVDFFNAAHQPTDQINAVNALIHQTTAAVKFPGGAPTGTFVVIF